MVASAPVVIAVPSAMAKVAATPAQKIPCAMEKTSTSIAPEQGREPAVTTVSAASRQEKAGLPSVRGSGMWKWPQSGPCTWLSSASTTSQMKREAEAGTGGRSAPSRALPLRQARKAPNKAMPATLAISTHWAASRMRWAVALRSSASTPTMAIATKPCSREARPEITSPRFSARSLAII